jgi:hypothetical protein
MALKISAAASRKEKRPHVPMIPFILSLSSLTFTDLAGFWFPNTGPAKGGNPPVFGGLRLDELSSQTP